MAPRPQQCPQCGTPSPAEGRFCGGCGFDLESVSAPAADNKRTMMGMMAPVAPPGPAASPAASPTTSPAAADEPPTAPMEPPTGPSAVEPANSSKRTMMGMMAFPTPEAPTPQGPPASPSAGQPAVTQPQPTPPRGRARTMMGLTSPLAPPVVEAPALTSATPSGGGFAPVATVEDEPPTARVDPARAALPASPLAQGSAPSAQAPVAPLPAEAAQPAIASGPAGGDAPTVESEPQTAATATKVPAPQTQRTMLGMNLAPPPAGGDSGLAYGGAAVPGPGYGAGPVGLPPGPIAPGQIAPWQIAPPAGYGGAEPGYDDMPATLPTRRGGQGVLLGIALVLLLGGLSAGAWLLLGDHGESLAAGVVRDEGQEQLEVRFPEGSDATRVVMAGQEVPVEGGRALLPLAADALAVGTNRFDFEVVRADDSRTEHSVEVELRYRLAPDLSGLAADVPTLAVQVEAPAGTRVTLDGTTAEVDDSGRWRWEQPIPAAQLAAQAGPLTRQIPFRVEFAGDDPAPPEEGAVGLSVPRVPLALARPGLRPVTDQERVELVAEVGATAGAGVQVRLDGASLSELPPSSDAPRRFGGELVLPAGERTFVLDARAPGFAPARLTLEARRVADLEAEVREYGAAEIPYPTLVGELAQRQGERVSFVARVYNAGAQGEPRAFQVLVRDCPGPSACPLWLDVVAAQTPSEGAWVRVFGEVSGEQSFRTESGEVLTVPRLSARYLLPGGE